MRHGRAREHSGFTLVEILMVVVVLGILSTVTVFAVRGITDRGQEAACSGDGRTLTIAASAYMTQNDVLAIPATGANDGNQFERTLVDAGLITQVSTYFDLDADGSLVDPDVACDD